MLKSGYQKPMPSGQASQKIVRVASLTLQKTDLRRWTPELLRRISTAQLKSSQILLLTHMMDVESRRPLSLG